MTLEIKENIQNINSKLTKILEKSIITDKCQLLAVSKIKPIKDIIAAYDAG